MTALRARVASIVASAVPDAHLPPLTEMAGADVTSPASVASPARVPVQSGIDVLRAEGFARLNGRHVGLLTNQSGRRRFETNARRICRFGHDDVSSDSRHHAKRVLNGSARRDRESQFREHQFGARDDALAGPDEQDERRKASGISGSPAAACKFTAIRSTSMVGCVWHVVR